MPPVWAQRHYSINSSYGNLPVMLGAEPEARAEVHPIDAAARHIEHGDNISVFNDLGRVTYTASVSDKVPQGTISVPFGRWNTDAEPAGANSLTADTLGDLANGPTFCDNLVEAVLVEAGATGPA